MQSKYEGKKQLILNSQTYDDMEFILVMKEKVIWIGKVT